MNIKKLLSYTGFPVLAVLIIVLSLYPKLPESLVAWNFLDKIAHLSAYLILSAAGILFFKMLIQKSILQILLNGSICILLGGLIELVQPLTGRHADIYDFLVNIIGVVVGILLVKLICFLMGKIKKSPHCIQ